MTHLVRIHVIKNSTRITHAPCTMSVVFSFCETDTNCTETTITYPVHYTLYFNVQATGYAYYINYPAVRKHSHIPVYFTSVVTYREIDMDSTKNTFQNV